jgi:hypothetical protein
VADARDRERAIQFAFSGVAFGAAALIAQPGVFA